MSNTVAENQAYFNNLANDYDKKFAETIGQLEHELKSKRHLIGFTQGGRLLDYACGTGLMSRALGQHVSQCIGIDVSERMVEAYNAEAKTRGLSPDVMAAFLGDLTDPSDAAPTAFSDPKFFDFDVAGVGLAWHHLDDCALAAKRLAERLRSGGVLFVVDFLPHELAAKVATGKGVKHHGFASEQMHAMFEAAGVAKNFVYEELQHRIVFHKSHGEGEDKERRVFIARGTKA